MMTPILETTRTLAKDAAAEVGYWSNLNNYPKTKQEKQGTAAKITPISTGNTVLGKRASRGHEPNMRRVMARTESGSLNKINNDTQIFTVPQEVLDEKLATIKNKAAKRNLKSLSKNHPEIIQKHIDTLKPFVSGRMVKEASELLTKNTEKPHVRTFFENRFSQYVNQINANAATTTRRELINDILTQTHPNDAQMQMLIDSRFDPILFPDRSYTHSDSNLLEIIMHVVLEEPRLLDVIGDNAKALSESKLPHLELTSVLSVITKRLALKEPINFTTIMTNGILKNSTEILESTAPNIKDFILRIFKKINLPQNRSIHGANILIYFSKNPEAIDHFFDRSKGKEISPERTELLATILNKYGCTVRLNKLNTLIKYPSPIIDYIKKDPICFLDRINWSFPEFIEIAKIPYERNIGSLFNLGTVNNSV